MNRCQHMSWYYHCDLTEGHTGAHHCLEGDIHWQSDQSNDHPADVASDLTSLWIEHGIPNDMEWGDFEKLPEVVELYAKSAAWQEARA